ncbi:MAG: hypothetical protein ACE37K_22230 [Planctomycetota bacterium]
MIQSSLRVPSCIAASLTVVLFAAVACHAAGHPAVEVVAPAVDATEAVDLPGLHNVVSYGDQIVCGGVPEGRRGLEVLRAMGIRTVVSVDGATPDVATAEQLGLRYVHLPISYDTVTRERQRELAQVLVHAERPIYMHCHHGKHRSAAALASAMVMSGTMGVEQACARMSVSGTSPSYEGLWEAVRSASALPAEQLQADMAQFPSVAEVSGMVGLMAEVDEVIDLVRQSHEAGWRAPQDHPDLVAEHETRRLARLFADMQQDEESRTYPDDYQQMLAHSIDLSQRLDQRVRAGDAIEAGKLLAAIGTSCKACHKVYRNR